MGLSGEHGTWNEFLKFYDPRSADICFDPNSRPDPALIQFLTSINKKDDSRVQLFIQITPFFFVWTDLKLFFFFFVSRNWLCFWIPADPRFATTHTNTRTRQLSRFVVFFVLSGVFFFFSFFEFVFINSLSLSLYLYLLAEISSKDSYTWRVPIRLFDPV